MRPLVSFVIPVRNDAERLRRCLTSIVSNDYPRALIEIVVIDNESEDGSGRAAREYGAIVLRSPGTCVAELRNRGARAALGSIIAFVDADHEIDQQWITAAVAILSTPEIAATGCAYLTEPQANWVQQQYDGLRVRPEQRQEVAWIGSGNFAVKRSAFERVGGFNTTLTACEDVDLCNRLRQAGHRIVADPALRSVHFGDPRTLKALFFGELWRGRDNLKVTFSGPRTFQHLRSALLPVADLLIVGTGIVSALTGHPFIAVACLTVALVPALARAVMMSRRRRGAGDQSFGSASRSAAQALAVSVVFDAARAVALVARGSHRARRVA
ncbi:MAG: glycosyltransferase [Acidobacteriota bacterium]|nr:glycosyltransferase [Acidobacteriota bacterium]